MWYGMHIQDLQEKREVGNGLLYLSLLFEILHSHRRLTFQLIQLHNYKYVGNLRLSIVIILIYFYVRLALVYRSRVAVSRVITYQLPLRVVPSRIELTSQLQLSNDKVAICWKGEPSVVQFKVSLATLDGNSLFTDTTDKRCYLLQSLSKENCCRVTIMDVTAEEQGYSTSVKLDLMQPIASPSDEESQATTRLIFSTGSKLLQLRNVDDYIVSEEPLSIPFEVPEGESITSLEAISSSSLVVGSSRGSVWLLSLEYNDTTVSTTPNAIRQADEEGHAVTQIEYDFMQNAIYVVLSDKGIARCTLKTPTCSFVTNADSLNPTRSIAVDSVNGFLYLLGADHQVYRTELFPFEVVENYKLSNVVPFPGTVLAIYSNLLYAEDKLLTLPFRYSSDIGY
ncbi:unnamed protein product [Strongylus vulgaris]|uniref:Uncharacterized protein n=1 Tax=Strongylus vulgaris TaxID=40348 RepID=A0A3P7I5W8_STRVU|nr:unnamed protein product [Strongylus vulgaris]